MKKELKLWYCSDNNFYYISYDGKEIASISGVKSLSVDHLNEKQAPIFINEANSLTIQIEENKTLSITQGDGIDPDNIIISIGEDIYHLQVTGNCPYVEYTGQKRTKLFAHKIWMKF